jgi:hypothetical protein
LKIQLYDLSPSAGALSLVLVDVQFRKSGQKDFLNTLTRLCPLGYFFVLTANVLDLKAEPCTVAPQSISSDEFA